MVATTDARGRRVELTEERWSHITDSATGHPEMASLQAELLVAVENPDRRLPGRASDEEWLYLAGVGPSRWIKVVVVFDAGGVGRIVTAFPRRSIP